jgi:hypothetical protein
MGGASNQRIVIGAEDWMRQQEKRTLREQRRPQVHKASDLLGPGFAPQAVAIDDWNDDATLFNGFFYTAPGALNTPDDTKWWIGQTIAMPGGFGIQTVWDMRGTSSPPTNRSRRFTSFTGERVFSTWA